MDKLLISEKETAARFGFTVSWLRAARVRGGGPQFVKIGKKVMYRIEDLQAFVAARLVSTTSEVAKNGR